MDLTRIKNQIYPWVKRKINDDDVDNQNEITVDIPTRKLLADLVIIYVVDLGDRFEVLQQEQIPDQMSEQELYELAVNNLSNNVKFTLQTTNYGGYGLLAGGNHEAGAICLDYLWEFCSNKIGEDIIVSIPSKDMVLMVGASQKKQLIAMKNLSLKIIEGGDRTLTKHLFLYNKYLKQFSVYE